MATSQKTTPSSNPHQPCWLVQAECYKATIPITKTKPTLVTFSMQRAPQRLPNEQTCSRSLVNICWRRRSRTTCCLINLVSLNGHVTAFSSNYRKGLNRSGFVVPSSHVLRLRTDEHGAAVAPLCSTDGGRRRHDHVPFCFHGWWPLPETMPSSGVNSPGGASWAWWMDDLGSGMD